MLKTKQIWLLSSSYKFFFLPHPRTISAARLSLHPGCLLGDGQRQGVARPMMYGDDPRGAVFVLGGIAN
jgi:hypothetical protein